MTNATNSEAQDAANASANDARARGLGTLFGRIRRSFVASVGSIVGTRQNPFVQSAWMFFTDLFAAAVPVVPFALFALATARIVSLSVTFLLLVLLGVGRSMIGRRRVLPTVAETIVIAAAAAGAGILVGKLIA